jgi:hypothetical protein
MVTTLILILLGCIAIAAMGAVGERMMRYGKENGLIKENYGEEDMEKEVMEKDNKIRVLIKPAGQSAYFAEVENTLSCLQEIVGGYIETVTVAEDMVIICDEEGRFKNSKYNCSICGVQFFGTVMLCGVSEDEFASLPVSDKDIRLAFKNLF